eukprot:Filipodium_phascolosomae@DN128_c0_g1_i1.p2
MEVQGDLMSCVRLRQWRDKCYWGVYKDPKSCCDQKPDAPFKEGGTCDCRGDMPVSQDSQDKRTTVLQAHAANATCLYNFDQSNSFRPCNPDSKPLQWRLIERIGEGDSKTYYQVMGAARDDCLAATTESTIQMEECKNRDHDDVLLWDLEQLNEAGQGFFLMKGKKTEKCLAVGEANKVSLRDCNRDEQPQWWMAFNLAGRKITADEKDERDMAVIGSPYTFPLFAMIFICIYTQL